MIDNMPLLVIVLAFVMTFAVVRRLGYRGGAHSAHMGAVSDQWIAAYRASEPASSI